MCAIFVDAFVLVSKAFLVTRQAFEYGSVVYFLLGLNVLRAKFRLNGDNLDLLELTFYLI